MAQSFIRPLSIHEASFPLFAQLSPGAGNIVSQITVEGQLAADAFETAVNAVVNAHEVLQATYVHATNVNATGGTSKPAYYWTHTAEKPRVEVMAAGGDIEALAHLQMERMLNEPFRQDEPLCRFLMLHGDGIHKIFACVSHGVMDGSSIIGLLQRIVAQLAAPVDVAPVTFPPALWDYMPAELAAPTGIFRCLDVLLALIGLQKKADKGLAFQAESPAPAAEHRCMFARRQLSVEQSKQLVALSKQAKTSVHGLLGAAVGQAFVDHLRAEKGDAFCAAQTGVTLPLMSTMDLRRRTQPALADDLLGCFSSGATHNIDCQWVSRVLAQSDYTRLAANVDATLGEAIKRNQHWKILRIYQLLGLSGMKKLFRDGAEKPMSMPLSLANVGRLQFAAGENFRVVCFEGAAAFHANGPSINVQSYMVNDQLTLSLAAALPQISRATLERFADRVLAHLASMV